MNNPNIPPRLTPVEQGPPTVDERIKQIQQVIEAIVDQQETQQGLIRTLLNRQGLDDKGQPKSMWPERR